MDNFERIHEYLRTRSSLPPSESPENASFIPLYYELTLDQQIILLRDFALKTNDGRAWKILGLRYFWTRDDAFLEDAMESLRKALSVGFDGVKDAVHEIMACCYALLGDEASARQCIVKSTRANLGHILTRFGSLRHFADEMRYSRDGLRFRGLSSGNYTKDQLHLKGCSTHAELEIRTGRWRRGCENSQVDKYLINITQKIEATTPFRVYFHGAERLNEIDPLLTIYLDNRQFRKGPHYDAGHVWCCYVFFEIDTGDNLVNEQSKELDVALGKLSNLFDMKENARAMEIMKHYVYEGDFAEYLSRVIDATVHAGGAIVENGKRYREFAWILTVL